MLPKPDAEEERKFAMPPKIKFTYQNFKSVAERSTYRVFKAEDRTSSEIHTIRILDCTKEHVN